MKVLWTQYGETRILEVEGILKEDEQTIYYYDKNGRGIPMPKHKIISVDGKPYP